MSHDQGLRAVVRRIRRGLRQHLSGWLAKHGGTPRPVRAPLPPPRRILVCRLNARLGNSLFLTPLLRSLSETFPDATIDVLLRDPAHVTLLIGMPGLERVHVLPDRPWRVPGLVRRLRRERYDLAIDPSIQSAGNRTAVALSGARYRLGFAGDDQWLRLTHAAPRPTGEPHQARQALHLLTDAVEGPKPRLHHELAVFPGTRARREADALLREALGPAQRGQAWPVVGFFGEATGVKRLPRNWWRAWQTALARDGAPLTILQIVPPGGSPITPETPAVGTSDLATLAAVIGRLDLFVAADSGPMHLAAAAGTPVIGLFKATSPAHYAPLGRDCLALPRPLVAGEIAEITREQLERTLADQPRQASAGFG